VSYTEVVLRDEQLTMRYQPGAPCSSGTVHEATLRVGSIVAGD
jgi:hypothetical protein